MAPRVKSTSATTNASNASATNGGTLFHRSVNAAVVGTVRDLNEALVAKAQIKVTSAKTGEVRQTETNDDGTFTVTNLEPSTYDVEVQAPGFQPVT